MKKVYHIKQYDFKENMELFKVHSNNFKFYFYDGKNIPFGFEHLREQPYFKKFQKEYSPLEKKLTDATTSFIDAKGGEKPSLYEGYYGDLFKAYNFISSNVLSTDENAIKDGKPDEFLVLNSYALRK